MQIDFRTKLISQTGEPLEAEERKDDDVKKVQMTLGGACSKSLLSVATRKDMEESGEVKYKRWQLAGKIMNTKEAVDVTAEEIVLIKKHVGNSYGPVVVGPVYDILEGKNGSKETNTTKVETSKEKSK